MSGIFRFGMMALAAGYTAFGVIAHHADDHGKATYFIALAGLLYLVGRDFPK